MNLLAVASMSFAAGVFTVIGIFEVFHQVLFLIPALVVVPAAIIGSAACARRIMRAIP